MTAGIKANVDGSAAIQVGGTDVITLTSGGAATFVTSPTTVQAGTAAAPSITFSGDTNTGIYSPGADTIAFTEGGVESMRIDSSGNVGIGTSSPGEKLTIVGAGVTYASLKGETTTLYQVAANGACSLFNNAAVPLTFGTNTTERMRIDASGNVGIGTSSPSSFAKLTVFGNGSVLGLSGTNAVGSSYINFYANSGATNTGYIGFGSGAANTMQVWNISNEALQFATNNAERARITSAGDFIVGQTTQSISLVGASVNRTGELAGCVSGSTILYINRKTNDGNLVSFRQDDTEEGTISVSGTTVSYNGGHLARWSQLLNGQRDESIVKGTVLSNLDEMCEWLDAEGNPLPNEQLNRTKVSDVEGDANVAGVFVNWDNDDPDNPYDMNIAMTGDMIIRIAQGVTVQKGDLLMSAGDGTAKPQGDDIVRSKTVAKVTSNHVTCTYEDGSYCVPCVLMAC